MGQARIGGKNLQEWNMQYSSYCEVKVVEEARTKENEMRRIRRARK